MDLNKTGKTIARLRKSMGFTQASLAEKLGISDKAVSKWETGKAKPTTDTLRKMAVLYGLSVDKLLEIREGAK